MIDHYYNIFRPKKSMPARILILCCIVHIISRKRIGGGRRPGNQAMYYHRYYTSRNNIYGIIDYRHAKVYYSSSLRSVGYLRVKCSVRSFFCDSRLVVDR